MRAHVANGSNILSAVDMKAAIDHRTGECSNFKWQIKDNGLYKIWMSKLALEMHMFVWGWGELFHTCDNVEFLTEMHSA